MSPSAKQKISSFGKWTAAVAVILTVGGVLGEGLIWRGEETARMASTLEKIGTLVDALKNHVEYADKRFEELQKFKTDEALTSQGLQNAVKVLEEIKSELKHQTAYGLKHPPEKKDGR